MSNVKREFYEVEGAAELLSMNLSDIWHLIEIGRISASIRQFLADTTMTFNDNFSVDDYIINQNTFLISRNAALEIAVRGTTEIKKVLMIYAEPKEELMIDSEGQDCIVMSATFEIEIDKSIQISKSDIIITQRSINQYSDSYVNLHGIIATDKSTTIDKPLIEKERETLLIIIAALAREYKVNITKTSKAGDLIANLTQILGVPIGATTIERHLKQIPQALENRAK